MDLQDQAERGESPATPAEKTPLLRSTDEMDQKRRWSSHLSFLEIIWAATLAPVYSVLMFLPMLPFWIFAGFLVYLLGTATNNNFYLYCGVLTVVMPFNIVGTVAIVRRVWIDLYGD
jgi:hypothetical protein